MDFGIAVLLESVSPSDLAQSAIESINEWCRSGQPGDVSIFATSLSKPCVVPICPLLDLSRMTNEFDAVIATSTPLCLEALNTNATIIIHYVWTPDALDRIDIPYGDVLRAYCDPRVRVVVRSESDRELIEAEYGCCVAGDPVSAFDFTQILDRCKNGQR